MIHHAHHLSRFALWSILGILFGLCAGLLIGPQYRAGTSHILLSRSNAGVLPLATTDAVSVLEGSVFREELHMDPVFRFRAVGNRIYTTVLAKNDQIADNALEAALPQIESELSTLYADDAIDIRMYDYRKARIVYSANIFALGGLMLGGLLSFLHKPKKKQFWVFWKS